VTVAAGWLPDRGADCSVKSCYAMLSSL
jgi:hypothetical protein